MKNSELLKVPPHLLTGLQRQERFLVGIHVQQRPCPNCGNLMNFYEGLGVDIDDYDYREPVKERFECTRCYRELVEVVPFVSVEGPPWYWGLVPIEVEPDDHDDLQDCQAGLTGGNA